MSCTPLAGHLMLAMYAPISVLCWALCLFSIMLLLMLKHNSFQLMLFHMLFLPKIAKRYARPMDKSLKSTTVPD